MRVHGPRIMQQGQGGRLSWPVCRMRGHNRAMRVPVADDERKMPRAVWVLGLVSLFMDMSSELIHAVLPVYLTAGLGLSVLAVGVIEGIAEATASMMKLVSGALSDRFAARKPLVVLGYGLAALTKPVFPLADGAAGVVAARFVDRVGKGIRGAPRDAVVADVTPPSMRDAAYGLRQALDTVGAFLGPLIAMVLIVWWAGDLRAVLWAAVVPAMVAVVLLVLGLKEPPHDQARGDASRTAFRWTTLREFSTSFWGLIVLAALFALARLAEAFLVLRAQELQVPLALVPLVLIVMSASYAASAYPAGLVAARHGRRGTLAAGLAALAAAYALLAATDHVAALWAGIALYGLHMGLTQGALSAAVAAASPAHWRATGFGVFHFVTGVCQLGGAALAGWLWTTHGSASAFAFGGAAALAALAVACAMRQGLSDR
jgi:MFS family permease